MRDCVRIAGDIKSAAGETPAAFIVECVSDVPLVMLVDYLFHYLDAGTREECESHPMLHDTGNAACAVLTYRYLRPRGQMHLNRRTQWLTERPEELGPELFSDDVVRVWGVTSAIG
jgi:hypothetical protein